MIDSLSVIEIGKSYERPWGRYIVLEIGEKYLVKRIEVDPGKRFSLQYHNFRHEVWAFVAGEGRVTLDDRESNARTGDVVEIKIKQVHRCECISDTKAVFIEIQRGEELREDDIVRLSDDYGRK